jgi:cell division septum initiation protein DivIVA
MVSKIEQLIDELQTCIDDAKPKFMDSTKIIVDKEEIEGIIDALRKQTPEEIKQLRKIIANKDAILNDAKEKADALINQATAETTELLSEHQIMRQAYAQADEVVACATYQAQEIIDRATIEANQVRDAAIQYTDDMLANMEQILASSIDSNNARFNDLQNSLNHYYQIVKANREDLHPAATGGDAPRDGNPQVTESTTGEINLDML